MEKRLSWLALFLIEGKFFPGVGVVFARNTNGGWRRRSNALGIWLYYHLLIGFEFSDDSVPFA
jgi:hypothetical protein